MQFGVDLSQTIGALALVLCITIFPILAIFRKTRPWSATGFFVSSIVFGFGLWVISALIVGESWGSWAVIIGTFMLGVGVLPMALAIICWNHTWELLVPLAAWGVPLILSRVASGWIYSTIR